MYLIASDGMRLCQDDAWRVFADYGTYPSCVKEYKSLAAARRKAKRVQGSVVKIPDGMSIDAAGQVIETVKSSPGWEKVKIHRLEEFIVVGQDPA